MITGASVLLRTLAVSHLQRNFYSRAQTLTDLPNNITNMCLAFSTGAMAVPRRKERELISVGDVTVWVYYAQTHREHTEACIKHSCDIGISQEGQ